MGFLSALGVGVTGPYSAIRSNAVATDAAGDTFVTGSFRGTAAFNPSSSSNTFTTDSTQDTFVAKYGPTGSLVWVSTFAGQPTSTSGNTTYAESQGSGIVVDGSGDVFVAGSFTGTINVTGTSGVTQEISTTSATEPFVAKLSPTGNVTWFDAIAGTTYDTDSANALALNGSGGLVIAGVFSDSATFGATILTAGGPSDAFVAMLNGSGAFQWALATQGSNGSNASAQGVAIDGSGNIDLAGFFSGSVDFDPTASLTTLTSAGSDDAMLWKLGPSGSFLWARSYGSTDYDTANAVAVDASGDLYATGAFSDTVNFGTVANPDSITAGPVYDAFLLKVDPNGNTLWVDGLVGPSGSSKGQGVAVDPSGTVHVAGTFSGPLAFSATDTLTSVGTSDAFVAGYGASGSMIYALQAGETNFNASLGVAVNATGLVAITGTYSGSITFGSTTLSSLGTGNIFVAQVVTQFPPPAPSAPVLEASSDSGSSNSDGITNDSSPVFDVNAAIATDTVELLRNGVEVSERTGPGALQDPGPVPQGTYTYTALQVSPVGLAGPASAGCSVTILTTPPSALPAPTLDPADDSGIVGDGITNVNKPRLEVVAGGGLTVQLLNAAGTVVGSAYQASGGTCLVTPFQLLADGVYQLSARAVDVAGNMGPAGPAFALTIDTTPPAAPSILTLLTADDSGTLGDDITNVKQARLTGTAEPGSTVQVVDGNGNVDGTAVAALVTGSFTIKVSSPLSDGSYMLAARAKDAAGNQGPAGPSITLIILATPPPMPSTPSIVPADVSGPTGSNLTNVGQPRITGTAKAGTTVKISTISGTMLASTIVGMGGGYAVQVTSPLADGTYVVDTVATDVAGNVSPASGTLTFTIDTTPPAAPSILTLLPTDDSGTLGDDITNVKQPRLSGTAEPGSTVKVVDGNGNVDGSAVATLITGAFMVKLSNPLADGSYVLAARATDAAGNQGPLGPQMTMTILATPPPMPSTPTIVPADVSGPVGSNLTNVTQPRITGSAKSGTTVNIMTTSGALLASAVLGSSTSYTAEVTNPLANGTYVVDAIATDAAGNVSPASGTLTFTIDTTTPATPSIPTLFPADDSGTLGDDITNVRQPRLTGTATAGLTIRLVNASNVVLGTATATSSGSVTVVPSAPLTDGTYALEFVAVDAAGNVSAPGKPVSLTILATPPPQPSAPALLAANDTGVLGDGMTSVRRPIVIGTASPGDQVAWLQANGSVLVSTTASASNGSYQLQPPTALINGAYPVTVRQTDIAGNVSLASKVFTLTVRADPGDDFGNSQSDISVFRPTDGYFFVKQPTTGALFLKQFGGAGDVPVNGDFFGNGHNDIAVYQSSTSTFYYEDPVTGGFGTVQLGVAGDVPVPADYDGDGKTDFAVFNPSTSTFLVRMSATNTTYTHQFGPSGSIPVPADYFGNGHADLAVYLPSNSTFYVYDPIGGATKVVTVGLDGSTPVPADYEGLGHVDPTVYEPGTSTYVIQMSATNTTYTRQFGPTGSIPVPGDYFGKGRADLAVYQPSSATFFALDIPTSGTKVVAWGTPYVTLPTLAPITTWLKFGGSALLNAIKARPSAYDATDSALIPLTPDLAVTAASPSVEKAKVVDRTIDSLSLESWRPGD
jgi:hypothetical protein